MGRFGVRVKQRIHSPLFERLFCRISVLRVTSRRGGCYLLYVSGALRRTDTLFYPGPRFGASAPSIIAGLPNGQISYLILMPCHL